jgi:argininosuccinate lyase
VEAARLYQEQTQQAFPLNAAGFAEIISAEYMVFGRKGIGGPQLAEVNRMLSAERDLVAAEHAWLKTRGDHLARAEAALDRAFAALAG